MSSYTTADIVTELKALLVSVIGTIGTFPAIVVEPSSTIQTDATSGLLCVVQRVSTGEAVPLTSNGWYKPPYITVKLVNYSKNDNLSRALDILRSTFVSTNLIYSAPTSRTVEMATIKLFLPDTY